MEGDICLEGGDSSTFIPEHWFPTSHFDQYTALLFLVL